MSFRTASVAFLKLAISGFVIAAIAAIFLVVTDEGDVSEAQADVTNLHPASVSQHGSFGRVLRDNGLEPEAYDWNGNLVYFAVGESSLRPDELNLALQKRLVKAGINSKVHETNHFTDLDFDNLASEYETLEQLSGENWVPQQLELNRAQLNGELVPQFSTPYSMQLSGIIPPVKAQDSDELHRQLESQVGADGFVDIEKRTAGFRFIEAIYDERTGGSNVTATWADHGFDPKAISEPKANHSMELELPPCIGCDRTTRFAALENEPFVMNQFTTSAGPHNVLDFYEEVMPRRGWQPSEAGVIMDHVVENMPGMQGYGELIQFQRDEHFISVYATQDPTTHKTSVISVMGQ